jgi:hypothetical protein
MSASTRRRRNNHANKLKCYTIHRRKISNAAIIRGVEVEFDRTLPFWRCYTDLRLETRQKPEVVQRRTQLLCRVPCKVFKHVDVVWARTQVQLRRVFYSRASRVENAAATDRDANRALAAHFVSTAERNHRHNEGETIEYTIDTLHFVHEDAYRKNSPSSEHSFHVQSVVLRDAPAVLQCVAGAMVSFAFLTFTSLKMIHMCKVNQYRFAQLRRELNLHIDAWTSQGSDEVNPVKRARLDGAEAVGSHDASAMSLHSVLNGSAVEDSAATAYAALRKWCPPTTSRVLILGMGGNSMALALRAVLGPAAVIEVVEVEPAVVAACVRVGTLHHEDARMKVHLQDADTCLRTLPGRAYDIIFMDIFEPMEATMKNLHPWVAAAREKLTAGGLLVMNEHQLPSSEGLAPYGKLFGDGNVQAVNVRGWNESVVVCVAPGDVGTDTNTLEISKSYTDMAFNVYEALMPGWLPHFSWLVSAKTHHYKRMRFRLWTS